MAAPEKLCGDCGAELGNVGFMCDLVPTRSDVVAASAADFTNRPYRCAVCQQKVCLGHPEDCETVVLFGEDD